jgi:spore coat polysaccharide biosynthesis protein SpsF
MKTVAIIQARFRSSRLPGKVLMDIAGAAMLDRVVHRVSRSNRMDEIVIATPDRLADHPIWDYCEQRRWKFACGDESDVLSRYYHVAVTHRADVVVRITADCPLLDPDLIDQTIDLLHNHPRLDYASNLHPFRRFPRGLDVEAIRFETLKHVHQRAASSDLREHVTLMICRNPNRFQLGGISNPVDFSHLRWTVDTESDLQLVSRIYRNFGRELFGWREVVEAYQFNSDWQTLNQHVLQKSA